MQDPTLPPSTPVPTDPNAGQVPPAPGSPTSPTNSTYQRSWTNPNGQRTQLYERSVTDNGYSIHREQTWANPDGTPLRQHETTITGTDPYNFQRERMITLRDGRTIEHDYTQTWDGMTLQRERTFSGPNGQTHNFQFQQQWAAPSDGSQPTTPPTVPTVPEQPVSPPVASTPETFGAPEASAETRTTDGVKPTRSKMHRPSGFTLGASARGAAEANARGLTSRQPGQAETGARHQQIQRQLQQVERVRSTNRSPSPRSNSYRTR